MGGNFFHADSVGNMWSSVYADGQLQERTQVALFGLTDNEWDIDQLGGMFFD